jgi:glycosyltransferase involved in cell wall biosynthesis
LVLAAPDRHRRQQLEIRHALISAARRLLNQCRFHRSVISAVVRTKNSSHVIGGTLQALRNQSSLPDEVIVVDSGSTDDTLAIVAREWPEAVVLNWPGDKPFSYSGTLNLGIARAQGDLILIVSSHTQLQGTNVISRMKEYLGQFDAVGAYCHYRPAGDESAGPWPGRLVNVVDGSSFNGINGLWNACSLIRRKAWEEQPFSEEMPTAEDQAWARWQYEHRGACTVCIRDLDVRYLSRENTVRKSAFEAAVVARYLMPPHRTLWHLWRTAEEAAYAWLRRDRETAGRLWRTTVELAKLRWRKPVYSADYYRR